VNAGAVAWPAPALARATRVACAVLTLFIVGATTQGCTAPKTGVTEPPRRSGFEDMAPATQALQRDDNANPGFLWVQGGQQRFKANCEGCHTAASLRGVATRYPAFDAHLGQPLNLAGRIKQCATRDGHRQPLTLDNEALLELEVFVAHQSRGLPLQAPADPRLASALQEGKKLWNQRLGQLGLSCAECHDALAARRLGGSTIPQAHPTGYPLYRLEWQGLGSLQRRLRGCITGVRAEPFSTGAREWVALELWLLQRAAGMAVETPGVRP
jgi:L-cysteine S-thiosulfotransferase